MDNPLQLFVFGVGVSEIRSHGLKVCGPKVHDYRV